MGFIVLLLLLFQQKPTQKSITCSEKIADPKNVRLYWKDAHGEPLLTTARLFAYDPKLTWVTNAGMYDQSHAPVGLYIENGKMLKPIKRVKSDRLNFGMKPQGVFLITKDFKAKVTTIDDPLVKTNNILYATQSSPVLVVGSRVSSSLSKSTSRFIRNGIATLKDGRVLLFVSTQPCTFQELAAYCINKGCTGAMMLDGVISCCATKMKPNACDINYGPMIGVY